MKFKMESITYAKSNNSYSDARHTQSKSNYKNTIKLIILLFALLPITYSCSKYKEITISNVTLNKIKLLSTSSAEARFGVEAVNPTGSDFALTNIKAIVNRDGTKFADINLVEEVTLKSNSDTTVTVNLYMHLLDPMSILSMGLDMNSWNLDEFKTDMRVTVKNGILKKTIKKNNVPLSKIMKQFNTK